MNTKSMPSILLLAGLFGTTLIASRFSVGQFAPTAYVGLRLTLATLGFVLLYTLRIGGRTFPKDKEIWKHGSILGFLGTAIPMVGIVTSLQYLSGGLASIIITVNPALTLLLAHIFLADEKLTWRKGYGVFLALSGAIMLVALGETGLENVEGNLFGYLMLLGAMFFASVMTIYTRKYMQEFDAIAITSIRMFVAAAIVMPLSYIFVGFDFSHVNSQGWLALLYAAIIGTFFGLLLSLHNLQRFGATAAVMVAYVIPVVATLTGVFLLDEKITIGMVGGMILISAGVWLLNKK